MTWKIIEYKLGKKPYFQHSMLVQYCAVQCLPSATARAGTRTQRSQRAWPTSSPPAILIYGRLDMSPRVNGTVDTIELSALRHFETRDDSRE